MRRFTTAAYSLAALGISAICADTIPTAAEGRLPYDLARLRVAGVIANDEGRSKIVGGRVVQPSDKYSFQVGLVISKAGPDQLMRSYFCGGSLIANTWVLTASHCVVSEDDVTGELTYVGPKDVLVFAGSANRRDGDVIEVKKVIAHRSYKRVTIGNDIALLQLERPPESGFVTSTIDYKAVAVDPSLSAEGKISTVTGWGNTEDNQMSDYLREVDVPIASNAVCDAAIVAHLRNNAKKRLDEFAEAIGMNDATYQEHLKEVEEMTGFVNDTMLCAGVAQGGKDSCQGDSGGPLFVTTADGKFAQVGVVSWGIKCGLPNLRGIYTRLGKFTSWIDQNMGAGN